MKAHDAAGLLGLGDDVQRSVVLPERLRAEDLDDASARHAADAQREVERERARRDGVHGTACLVAQAHDRALAELLLDLPQGRGESLALFVSHVVPPMGAFAGAPLVSSLNPTQASGR